MILSNNLTTIIKKLQIFHHISVKWNQFNFVATIASIYQTLKWWYNYSTSTATRALVFFRFYKLRNLITITANERKVLFVYEIWDVPNTTCGKLRWIVHIHIFPATCSLRMLFVFESTLYFETGGHV